ncbi:UPF0481 protein At3g47200-like [Asparagus officinalis]|uniref:UPF0481 protein At3g47200-like n=1 Tax=Asparagus officinalis TaxID=4686 RepID=UPI00098E5544|nr:UPF0481 protein At3g47200-like [Asparagus officinalis]
MKDLITMANASTSWIVDIQNKLKDVDTSTEIAQWRKHSIYQVPWCVKELNPKAYKPQIVSFGPYHHGDDQLKPMEVHKHRALLHFLKRVQKHLEEFMSALEDIADVLMDSYQSLDERWRRGREEFLSMMLVDACFLLEVLRLSTGGGRASDYAFNDPIFSNHGMLYTVPYIKRDMLRIENQLPLLVLEKLVAVETGQAPNDDLINKLVLKFSAPAIELNEAGIRLKKSKTNSLHDISFKHGVLSLPVVMVDDATEYILLNLMAFERLHVGAGNEVTSYVFFMDNMVDSAKDVAHLASRGIIHNAVGSDKAVAKLFNSLSKDVSLDPESSLDDIHRRVNDYCQKDVNRWRANLIHTYFRSPWSLLSLAAAIFLLALSVAQTAYSVLQYYESPSAPSPSS